MNERSYEPGFYDLIFGMFRDAGIVPDVSQTAADYGPGDRDFKSFRARKAFNLPKLFLRLRTKFHTSDFPMPLAKSFFAKSLVDYKGLEFYHRH